MKMKLLATTAAFALTLSTGAMALTIRWSAAPR